MNIKEFYEREFYINENGQIYDNSLNLWLEDEVLKVSVKKIKEIYNNQDEYIKEYFNNEKGGIL